MEEEEELPLDGLPLDEIAGIPFGEEEEEDPSEEEEPLEEEEEK